jgi:hypothetical protein
MNIEPIEIWKDGQVKSAGAFTLKSIYDDLATSATFYYELMTADVVGDDGITQSGEVLSVGNLSISGQEYDDWGDGSPINQWIYEWAADQLGLTII